MGLEFERGTDGPRVIVVAVDDSVTSLRAAAYASGLARRQAAELVVVFVANASVLTNFIPAAGFAVDETLRDVAADLRGQVEEHVAAAGIRGRFIEAKGDPYTEIFRICGEVLADAVMVGASTSTGHRLIGSVGVRLVRAGWSGPDDGRSPWSPEPAVALRFLDGPPDARCAADARRICQARCAGR